MKLETVNIDESTKLDDLLSGVTYVIIDDYDGGVQFCPIDQATMADILSGLVIKITELKYAKWSDEES